jgi:peptidoglycan hydrolase-like protein with peptidoglycan-binding domain
LIKSNKIPKRKKYPNNYLQRRISMKNFICLVATILCFSVLSFAQEKPAPSPTTEAKQKKPPVFRATKDQVMQAQKMLKTEETGKLSEADRVAIKKYQGENGLKQTGTLNRATLEKMKIELTDKQKEIPVSPNSYATGGLKPEKPEEKVEKKPRKPIFRATKDQVMQAQKMLKTEETGKLSTADRNAIKKFQEANGVKITGTLNKETLLKMGIELTDKQKDM